MAPPKTKKQASISRFFSPKGNAGLPIFCPTPSSSSSSPPAKRPVSIGVTASPLQYKSRKISNNGASDSNLVSNESPNLVDSNGTKNNDITPAKEGKNAPKISTQTRTSQPKPSKPPKLTPLESQYTQLKQDNPDKVLAIQVGYKYKFFGQDAVVASSLLNIMLIPGNIQLEERVHDRFAYCSIPDVRLHIHLQRLLNHGLKVGVVKQTESAAIKSVESTKSLFQRQITAVYTKATYMGDENVDEKTSVDEPGDDYIVCIYENAGENVTTLVGVQPGTGEIVYDEFACSRDDLDTRLAYMRPSEVILVGDGSTGKDRSLIESESDENGRESTKNGSGIDRLGKQNILETSLKLQFPNVSVYTVLPKPSDQIQLSLETLFNSPQTNHLPEYFALNFTPSVVSCIYELARHLQEFNLSNIFSVTSNITPFSDSNTFMVLPAGTLRALDIFSVHDDPGARKGTLLSLLQNTITRSGTSMLRKWISRPLVRKDDIVKRLNAVETLVSGDFVHILDAFRGTLVKLGKSGVEIDRSLTKIHYSATQENDRVSRKEVFLMLKCLSDVLQVFRDFGPACVADFRAKFPQDQLLGELLDQMSVYSEEKIIDGLMQQIDAGIALSSLEASEMKQRFFLLESDPKFASVLQEKASIQEVEQQLDAELGHIRTLLNRPHLQYVSVLKDTHLIEVRNGKQTDSLPADWLKISATKSVSRYRPASVTALHKQLQYHTEKLLQESDRCFKTYLQEIDSHHEYIRRVVTCLAQFDCLLSLATAAKSEISHTKPEIVDSQIIKIKSGVHPVLSHIAQQSYVPNDIDISYDENRVLIITGPNMGGKSSLVKQIALSVIMAQVGSFLPCTQAQLGVFDSVHIRMGASDNILKGQSTFMVEMQECANIIQSYSNKSLVILDEIGRGTGTKDGVALAYSILKYIIQDPKSPVTLFITHYPSLHGLEYEHNAVHNYHMAFLERKENGSDWPEVIFLYKVVRGVVSNSYGLNVAKLAGIETGIIDAAYEVSEKMKQDFENQLWRSIQEFDKQDVYASLKRVLSSLD